MSLSLLIRVTGMFVLLVMVAVTYGQGTLPQKSELPESPDAKNAEQQQTLVELRRMIDRGQASEALVKLDALASQHPVAEGVITLRGVALYTEGQYAEANAAFTNALKQNPRDEEATQLGGLTLFRLGKPAEAIPLLEAAHNWGAETKTDPSYVLAMCYIETQRYDDARRALAEQYGFQADSAAAYLLTARILLRREYPVISQQFVQKALALDPQLPLAHGLLGEIALAGGHLDDAIKEFEEERTRNPLEGSTYDRLGDVYTRAGNYVQAQRVLQQAIVLEPNATGPYILLGKVFLRRQDAVNAAMYLERAEKMDPSNFMTHNLLAQAYRMLGRTEDAKRQNELGRETQ
jgi:predicted Zn-dependent protease